MAKKPPERAVDPYKAELAERIATAFKTYNAKVPRGKELSQAEFAAAVSRRLHLSEDDAYKQTAVSKWMNPANPAAPEPPTLKAIAAVLGVDLMWLTYGARED